MNGESVVILLVEDDLSHAEITKRNLERFRVANRLVHVCDGQDALDYLRGEGRYTDPASRERPHLVLLDLRLPRVDGLEVLRQMKADPDLRAIPVVILTTSSAERDVMEGYNHHASSYLVKPVDFEQFTRLMDALGFYWLAWNRYPGH